MTLLILGAITVPGAAAVFLFGCCTLPLHGVMHHVIPFCHIAHAFAAEVHDDDHHDVVPPSAPEPPRRIETSRSVDVMAAARVILIAFSERQRLVVAGSDQVARNVFTIGALRVDDDVGLAALLATFRI